MTVNSSDKMARWPIPKLLFSMSLPAVFSMLIQACYNIVDSIYISQFSSTALYAVGLATPLQFLIISMALGGAVGSCTLVSRRLGQQNHDEANKTAVTGLLLNFFHWIVCLLIGLFLSYPFLSLFTSDAQALAMGHSYLSIVMCWSLGVFISVYFERLMQAQGNMLIPMFAQLIGAVTNIILDPILIFGYFGLPALGVAGAAIATVAGQILAASFCLVAMFTRKHEIHFTFRSFRLQLSRVKEIYSIGIPVMIMNVVGSITTTMLNFVLNSFSQEAVMALSIFSKLNSFVYMPVFGFNQGALPILSYNYGSKSEARYKSTVKLFLTCAFIYMGLGMAVFVFAPQVLLSLFTLTPEALAVTETCLRTVALSFIIGSGSIVMSTCFQSIGDGFSSMAMSLLRQLIFLIPLSWLFGKLFGLDAVWFAYPCAEAATVLIYFSKCRREVKNAFIYQGE